MKVSLLYATPLAVELLIFTKNTRLNMTPKGLDEIISWPREKKIAEIKYMSKTIPSSWEMVDLIFCIEGVSRAFTHQLVRTRTASFAQQTMRIVDMSEFEYVTGPSIQNNKAASELYEAEMIAIQDCYADLIKAGAKTEDARGVLPTNIKTNICMKINLRAFSDLVRGRTSPRVQNEYGQVLAAMISETLKVWPWSVSFIMPRSNDAHSELNEYLKEQLDREEKETGKPKNETKAWNAIKMLDIIRQEQ